MIQNNITIKNGMTALVKAGIAIPEMLDPTNKFTPNGGVIKPTANVATIKTPKWIGSKPISVVIGKRIGVNITTAAEVSMKHPIISNSIMINRIITSLFCDMVKNTLAIASGIFSIDSIVPKLFAVPIISKMTTEFNDASDTICLKLVNITSL